MKTLRLTLTTDDWRKLRLWAAQEDKSIESVVGEIVRGELASKPSVGF